MPHGCHVYVTASDMVMDTICAYPPSQHAFPHCKCMLSCCANFPRIHIPYQESDSHHSNTYPSILFHIYHLIAYFLVHVRLPLDEKKNLFLFTRYGYCVTNKTIHHKRSCCGGYIYYWFSHKFLYSINIKSSVLNPTLKYPW